MYAIGSVVDPVPHGLDYSLGSAGSGSESREKFIWAVTNHKHLTKVLEFWFAVEMFKIYRYS
jgi:hypothetical protein